jgi:general secretion pathway protein K
VRSQRSTQAKSSPKSPESGFILVVVLWILAALAALATSYLVYVDNAAFATQVNDDRLRIRNAISTGIELTAYQLLAAPDETRPPQGAFTVRLAKSTINVNFMSESARIDLNAASKGLLQGLFAAVGATPPQAASFADHIVAWRKEADPAGQTGGEVEAYKEAGFNYAPRQGPFQNVLELPLVLGIPPYIVERVLPLVTVYSGIGQIDVRVAAPEVLSALPDMTAERLQKILAQRAQNPRDSQSLLKLLGSAAAWANARQNPAARVQLQIRLDNGRIARAEVVILIFRDESEPFRVLSWRDDSDGSL